MRGQERSLHESPQFTWGEQYVLGALGGPLGGPGEAVDVGC